MIPKHIQEQIEKEAQNLLPFVPDNKASYIAGATEYAIWKVRFDELKAENERLAEELREARNSVKSLRYSLDQRTAQRQVLKDRGDKMADCLTAVRLPNPYIVLDSELAEDIDSALKDWQNKEPSPKKEIEYMPIHYTDLKHPSCPKQIPMHLLSEDQAEANHCQTLKRLKERGGISVLEALSLINRKRWNHYDGMKIPFAIAALNKILDDAKEPKD